MNLHRALRNNPFVKPIRDVLQEAGYHQYYFDQKGSSNFEVVIDTTAGKRSYTFARSASSFHTALNFKSRFKNWVVAELRDRGQAPLPSLPVKPKLPPPSLPRVEAEKIFATRPVADAARPPQDAARVNEVPKVSPPEVDSSPAQPSPPPSSPPDHDMAIVLSINSDNLMVVMQTLAGTAKLLRSGPLVKTSAPVAAAPVIAPKVPVMAPVMAPVVRPGRVTGGGANLGQLVLKEMNTQPAKYWTTGELERRIPGYAHTTFMTTMSNMYRDEKVERHGPSIYRLPNGHAL